MQGEKDTEVVSLRSSFSWTTEVWNQVQTDITALRSHVRRKGGEMDKQKPQIIFSFGVKQRRSKWLPKTQKEIKRGKKVSSTNHHVEHASSEL